MFKLKRIIYYLILIIILTSKVSSNILHKNENLEELTTYVSNFIYNNCKHCNNILLGYPFIENTIDNIFNHLNKKLYFTTYYSIKLNENCTIEDEFNNEYLPDLTVIIVNNFEQIDEVVYGLELLPFWSIRNKFLFIIEVPGGLNPEITKDVFSIFLERQIPKVLLCFWAADNIQLLTYNLFSEEYNLDVIKNNAHLELFNGRIKNMHLYKLKLYFFDYIFAHRLIKTKNPLGEEIHYGFDGIFYDLVAHVLNATLEIHTMSEDFSAELVNSVDTSAGFMDYMKALSDIYDFDGIFNALYTVNPGDELDHVILFDRNDLLILVPEAKIIPRYLYLILIIQPNVLYCMLISFFVLSCVMAFAEKFLTREFNLFGICLDNYRLLLNEAPPSRPNRSRILFIVWSLQCLVIVTLFQSSLISTLIKPKYYENIDTITDLLRTNFKIYGPEASVSIIKKVEKQNKDFVKRFVEISTQTVNYGMDLNWIYDYIDENAVLVCAEALWKTDPNKEAKYHIMEERAMAAYLWYSFRKDKNFYPEIRDISSWINQAGLYLYWRRYNFGEKFLNVVSNKTDLSENTNSRLKLKLEHFQGALLFLFAGYIIALIAFTFEVALSYINKI